MDQRGLVSAQLKIKLAPFSRTPFSMVLSCLGGRLSIGASVLDTL